MQSDSDSVESVWRYVWNIAKPETASSFYEALSAEHVAKHKLNAGASPASLSRNNSSTSYATPSPQTETLKQMEFVRLSALRLYERLAESHGFTAGSVSDADETTIYNAGLAELSGREFAEYRIDFQDLRCAR